MACWVLVDVADEALKVAIGVDGDALKCPFEETSGSFVCIVDGLRVPTEEIGKGPRVAMGREKFGGTSPL